MKPKTSTLTTSILLVVVSGIAGGLSYEYQYLNSLELHKSEPKPVRGRIVMASGPRKGNLTEFREFREINDSRTSEARKEELVARIQQRRDAEAKQRLEKIKQKLQAERFNY